MNLRTITALTSIALTSQLVAQTTASYTPYGYGCDQCVKSNEDAQTNASKTLRTQTLPNEYCYGFTAPSNITVHGFALFTRSTTGSASTMGTAFYPESATAGTPDVTATAAGSMTAEATAGWYVTKFAAPVNVASGGNFWVSGLDSNSILASSIAGGTATSLRIFWRRGTTATWSPTGIVSNPGVVIFCDETPILTASNTPKIPSTDFSIDLCNAEASSACFLAFGASNMTGPFGSLPTDLGILGFPGCVMWASNSLMLTGTTTTNNDFSWSLPISNNPAWDGLTFYVQSFVVGSGVGFSNAGKVVLGTL